MPRALIIALLATVLAPFSAAQMRGRPGPASRGTGSRHFRGAGSGYLYPGFYEPGFYSDYDAESTAPAPAPQRFVERKIMQPERPTVPLLIEWQGDRFVRYGGTAPGASPDYAELASRTPAAKFTTPTAISRELPPVVLVYRDGHREQVSDYVITRGVLYAQGDFWPQNSRDVRLSALDMAATFKANQDNGVPFALPTGSNDVVTRP